MSIRGYQIFTSANWLPKFRRVNIRDAPPECHLPRVSSLASRARIKVDAGEDAFFLKATPKNQYLGVADGVGGWERVGVNPALFSWSLMNNASDIIKENMSSMGNGIDLEPDELMKDAYFRLLNSEEKIIGSSTAAILKIDKNQGLLKAANLGDSTFLVIRDRTQIVYRSKEQQHFFNCPYQLSHHSTEITDEGLIRNEPKDCDRVELELRHNDLVILGTDGYFDNVYDEETIAIVQNELLDYHETPQSSINNINRNQIGLHNLIPVNETKPSINLGGGERNSLRLRRLSQKLVEMARRHSCNPKRLSPWANNMFQTASYYELGGKVDDITVIVALVQEINEED